VYLHRPMWLKYIDEGALVIVEIENQHHLSETFAELLFVGGVFPDLHYKRREDGEWTQMPIDDFTHIGLVKKIIREQMDNRFEAPWWSPELEWNANGQRYVVDGEI